MAKRRSTAAHGAEGERLFLKPFPLPSVPPPVSPPALDGAAAARLRLQERRAMLAARLAAPYVSSPDRLAEIRRLEARLRQLNGEEEVEVSAYRREQERLTAEMGKIDRALQRLDQIESEERRLAHERTQLLEAFRR